MRRRKEDQQKLLSDSKSQNHLHHPHYRHNKSAYSTNNDGENQFEIDGKKQHSDDFDKEYNWDGIFALHNDSGSRFSHKPQYFLGRIAKLSGNMQSYHMWITLNVAGILIALVSLYVCYFHFDIFHYNLCHLYARLGHADAQHIVGERLLHGKGVEKNQLEAMEWFRMAAQQGHPKSSYNLAIGHLSGLKTYLEVGEAHELIKHASDHGVKEAVDVYDNVCKHGRCD